MKLEKEFKLTKDDLIEATILASKLNFKNILMIIMIMIVLDVLVLFTSFDSIKLPFLFVSLLFIIFYIIIKIISNKKIKRKKSEDIIQNDIYYRYEFYNNHFKILIKSDETLDYNINYKQIVKCVENEKFIYFYINKLNCFILKKSEFSEEEYNILCNILK